MNESPPFIIVKFLSTDDDEDEYYEIALTKWLIDLDENMIGNIFWPEDNSVAGTLVRTQANAQLYWFTHAIEVKRYYNTYFQARKGLTEIREYASVCETDTGKEMGRRKRKKEGIQIESSDESDNDQDIKNQLIMLKKSNISSSSVIHVPEVFMSIDKNSDHKYKRNVHQDSSSIKKLKVTRHQDDLTTSDNTRGNLLKKRISKRKKVVEKKTEEKNNAMLLTAHSQVQQSSSQEQSKLSTCYVKRPRACKIIKSPENTVFNNCKELCDNTETKAKRKIKEPNSSTSCAVSFKTSSCTSENQLLSSEKQVFTVNPTNILRKSDDSLENSHKSSVLNLQLEEYNQINPLSHSLVKDTSSDVLSIQKENSLLSFRTEKQLDSYVRNLTDDNNALDFDLRFRTLEKKLDDISSKLEEIIMNQAQLNKSLPKQAIVNRPPNIPPLPLDDIKGLEEFEKFISDEANLSATCYYMKTFPLGSNEKTATSKLMTKLMTNSLALHFNFDGQNPHKALKIKRPFKKLKLWELVQGVMLLKFPASDLSETLNAVRSWLRNAAGRKS